MRDKEEKEQYEREKKEIMRDLENVESEYQVQIRESRNRQIEMEVDTRRTIAERDKVTLAIENEEKDGDERLEELN